MTNHGTRMPHLDHTVTPATLHERCEQIAVPDFDWFNEPIVAIVDGLLHRRPPAETPSKATTDEAQTG
ncbi:hypothetical protein [Actinoplanes sp. NPDC026619]|uniref:hypothetical protein n=1 Tax=Actinoplanes sp. NPDC026619 TaxID=3155798 RepID=UPI0033ECCEA6